MFPALQPSRPKVQHHAPQLLPAHQQKRATHPQPPSQPQPPPRQTPGAPTTTSANPGNPRNQVEAMPPFSTTPPRLFPPQNSYDSAIRHPVFFTEQLRKPPFPIPEMASRGFSPVACGYVVETKRADGNALPRTKL